MSDDDVDEIESQKSLTKYCPVCTATRGNSTLSRAEIEQQFRYGQLTIQSIAKLINCPEKDVQLHFKKCGVQEFALSKNESDLEMRIVQGKAIMERIILLLENRANRLLSDETSEIKDITAITKELRGYISELAKMKGELLEGPRKQVNIMVQDYRQMSTMMQCNLCPECKKKVLEQLETSDEMERLVGKAENILEA